MFSSDSVDESSNTIPISINYTPKNSFSMGDTQDGSSAVGYTFPAFNSKKEPPGTPIIDHAPLFLPSEEEIFSCSPIQPSRTSSNDGMRPPSHSYQSPAPSNSLATGTLATATPLFAFREPDLSQLDDSANTSEERAVPPFTPAKESGSMPVFSPVDLDMGSLEDTGAQKKPSPNHLTLQYHFLLCSDNDTKALDKSGEEGETQPAQVNDEFLNMDTQVMPEEEMAKVIASTANTTHIDDESQNGEIQFNFDASLDPDIKPMEVESPQIKEKENEKEKSKAKKDKKEFKKQEVKQKEKRKYQRQQNEDKETEVKELSDKGKKAQERKLQKEQERTRAEREEAQHKLEAQQKEEERKQMELEKAQREKELAQRKQEQEAKAAKEKQQSAAKESAKAASSMAPPVEPPKKATERKHFITVNDVPDSQDQPVVEPIAPKKTAENPQFHECEPTPEYTDFMVSKVKMPPVKQTFSARRKKVTTTTTNTVAENNITITEDVDEESMAEKETPAAPEDVGVQEEAKSKEEATKPTKEPNKEENESADKRKAAGKSNTEDNSDKNKAGTKSKDKKEDKAGRIEEKEKPEKAKKTDKAEKSEKVKKADKVEQPKKQEKSEKEKPKPAKGEKTKSSKTEADIKSPTKESDTHKRKLPFGDTPRRGRSKTAEAPENEGSGWKARKSKREESPDDKNTAKMVTRSRSDEKMNGASSSKSAKSPTKAKSPKEKKVKAVEAPRQKASSKAAALAHKIDEQLNELSDSKRPSRRVKRKRYTTADTQDEIDWVDEDEPVTKKKRSKDSESTPKSTKAAEDENGEETTVVKKKGLPIFKGMSFALTGLNKDPEADDSEKIVKQLIKTHGGHIVDTHQLQVTPNKASPKKNKSKGGSPTMPGLVLLADKPRRTLKYILAVATGIPCVNYKWIIQCCDKETLLPLEPSLLPAGSLIDTNKTVYVRSPSTDVFNDLRIEVVGTSDFKEGWTQVLRSTGARVVQRLFSSAEGRVECVLSDPSPDDIVVEKAKKLGVPVCSIEWLIQSILAQKPAKYDGHPSYYTFEEPSDD